ncbi:MAG: sigma-70 family RNA polymerase sigma factor [Candidatus Eisenbacteria bacterium]|uniref:Sigma-70 family RNA polymerase sigma factor n=1 Tax=Eiseniibacteriota bacterium TaxID=2212470 RepID=A0A948RUR5_UNCEI|nr:sigma-70 family RNA polymerase sigma factor [Candidatus Eisenbacteria bacterium]MBU1950985.1 sigma-70 family RNA polymerase sigma factor [Candidatus Eisenbacteria bacterium]MBU2690906.1 sigma-70 family RNA polymerase sigma factor [Candidatus Eisenbacteria bacterium]
MDITTLVGQCRKGDALAWELLVTRFQGRIYGLAYHYIGNAEEARDLAQDIFIRIYNRLDSCTNEKTFVPWMLRVARNMCIDRLRRRKARPPMSGVPVDEMTHLQADTLDPAEEFQLSSRKKLVHTALRKLSEINREIIVLKEIQGLSLEEISKMLKLPIGTVKSRSNRARIQLARQVLEMAGRNTEGTGD